MGTFIEFLKDSPDNSKEEYELISLLKLVGQNNTINYYSLLSEVLNQLGIKIGDEKIHYTLRENPKTFGLTIGQKYAVMITIKKGKITFGHFDTNNPSDDWWIEVNSIQNLLDAKSIIIDSALQEYSKTLKSGYKKHSSEVFERSILDNNYREDLFELSIQINQL